ncbi:MAG: peptidoglycan DD-metalloendopeptidase family protein [Nitrospirota bacterium]
MKKILIGSVLIIASLFVIKNQPSVPNEIDKPAVVEPAVTEINTETIYSEIKGKIKKGETFFNIFKRYNLDISELFLIREAAADVHGLRELHPGQEYKITVDDNEKVNTLEYRIDDDEILNITRTETGFSARKIPIDYEKKILHIGSVIKDNLINSIGEGKENMRLALQLSDIFAWDIDLSTDVKKDDSVKIVVEGLYLDGTFKKYGDIYSVEFINNGQVYRAYRFVNDGRTDYYDESGKSFRKAFLKAPLNFRRISSSFASKRFHPVLKSYRAHHGVDYSAPTGTPVSAVGDGKVVFAGTKGGYGRLIAIRHTNGYESYYGHLSRIYKGIRSGTRVFQGQTIGYVGSTGLATGPHLHYEVKINHKSVNPLGIKMPRGESVPQGLMASFKVFRNYMDMQLASIKPPVSTYAQMMNKGSGSNEL